MYNCSLSPHVRYPPFAYTAPETTLDRFTLLFSYAVILVCSVSFAIATWSNRFERLQKRRPILVWVTVVGVLIHVSSSAALVRAFPYAFLGYPCWLFLILQTTAFPVIAAPIVVRILVFNFQLEIQRFALSFPRMDRLQASNEVFVIKHEIYSHLLDVSTFAFAAQQDDNQSRVRALRGLRILSKVWGIILVLSALLLPAFVVALVLVLNDPVYLNGCTACGKYNPPQIYSEMGLSTSLFVLVVVFALRVRNLSDPFGLLRECSLSGIGLAVSLLGFYANIFGGFDPTQTFHFNFFKTMGLLFVMFVQSLLQVALAWANFVGLLDQQKLSVSSDSTSEDSGHSAYVPQARVLSSPLGPDSTLQCVFNDGELLAAFEIHLANEFAMELLLFLHDSQAFVDSYFEMSPATRQSRAKKLYFLYVDPYAPFCINISHKMALDLKAPILHGETRAVPGHGVFDEARCEVATLLEHGAVARFKQTDLFRNRRKELDEHRRLGLV